jgi:uncharacterized protein YutE (UPF0331/DUF86 family)
MLSLGSNSVLPDTYLAETRANAATQNRRISQALEKLDRDGALSSLEEAGVLHALQLLIENAIGRAKLTLKAHNQAVPISAYDAFAALAQIGRLRADELPHWKNAIGLRDRIVHDYMDLRMDLVYMGLRAGLHLPVIDFLNRS